MRSLSHTALVLSLCTAASFAACTEVTEPSDKNTNWLRECLGSDQCGEGLQCVCGVCSTVCDRDQQCAALDPDAACVAFASASCGAAPPPVCSVRCESSASCAELGAGLVCSEGSCAPDPEANEDAGGTAGMSGTAGTSGMTANDSGMPAAGASAPPELDGGMPSAIGRDVQDAVSSACGDGYACDARAASPGDVRSIAVGPSASVSWADFGTLDELGNHRGDGAIVSMPKAEGAPRVVHAGLDRPFRLWEQDTGYYWLSGDPDDFDQRRGLQTLHKASLDGSTPSTDIRSDLLGDICVAKGIYGWLAPSTHETLGEGVEFRWASLAWTDGSYTASFMPGVFTLGTMDEMAAYLEHGGTDIARISLLGAPSGEIVEDPPVYLASVDGDKLWVLHTAGDTDWIAWMPSTGGPVTHITLADAAAVAGRMQPGATVLWFVTLDEAGPLFHLWSIPKAGGDQEHVLSWPPRQDLPASMANVPVWIADGDEAWVSAHGTIVHVHRP